LEKIYFTAEGMEEARGEEREARRTTGREWTRMILVIYDSAIVFSLIRRAVSSIERVKRFV